MTRPQITPWSIEYVGPINELTQTIFTVGNGRLGMRGFSLQQKKSAPQDHACFHAGFFEQVKQGITDMVQLPDVFGLAVDGYAQGDVIHSLNLRTGVMTQLWRADSLSVRCSRMVSMADPQMVCIRLEIRADEDTEVTVRSVLDPNVANLPVHDDQMVEETETVPLLETVSLTENELTMRAVHSGKRLRCLCRLFANGQEASENVISIPLRAGKGVLVEKRVRVLLDDERANREADDPWGDNAAAWEALWKDCDIQMETDEAFQGALRWNLFQLLASNAADDPNVSIGARGLTHGRYKGNTFWDTDIFLLPFFCWHRPAAAANLIQYRLNRLADAERLAKQQNLSGARFPWMCSSDGLEQCESWDIGLCETHITADVAYALGQFRRITGAPLTEKMKELYAQTAWYWRSRFTWEENRQQYSSFFVKGPDEYCGAAVNNTYTNWMAKHNVELALEFAQELLTEDEKKELRHFADHITLLYDEKRGLYLQDEMFERLEPLEGVRMGDEPLYRCICFDRMQRYQILKQADLVQLMVLFPERFTDEEKLAVWRRYEPLTVHDSSLSFGVHALLAFQLGLESDGWSYFTRSLMLDLWDEYEHEGKEGVHMAALGASWQALVYGMLGLWMDEDGPTLHPHLPPEIASVSMRVFYHGESYRIRADHDFARITKEE